MSHEAKPNVRDVSRIRKLLEQLLYLIAICVFSFLVSGVCDLNFCALDINKNKYLRAGVVRIKIRCNENVPKMRITYEQVYYKYG